MPRWVGHDGAQLGGTTRYLPFVGIVVGAVGAGCIWAGAKVFPSVLAVLLSTAVTAVLTGAFHEDGLADTADGLGGGHTRERALEIMKDARIGAFGALALMFVLGAKVVALAALPDRAGCDCAGLRACPVAMVRGVAGVANALCAS